MKNQTSQQEVVNNKLEKVGFSLESLRDLINKKINKERSQEEVKELIIETKKLISDLETLQNRLEKEELSIEMKELAAK